MSAINSARRREDAIYSAAWLEYVACVGMGVFDYHQILHNNNSYNHLIIILNQKFFFKKKARRT